MNQISPHFAAQLDDFASRQLSDYDRHRPGMLFAEGTRLSLAEGYALQAAVSRLRQERGETVIGYKVGCTSAAIRQQLGIDHCVMGRLYDSEHHASNAVLPRGKFENLAIEGELAVELAREPIASDFDEQSLPECIARVFPVIELHNHVMRGETPTAGELVANNAIHAGFVAGVGAAARDALGEPSLAIFADGTTLDKCEGDCLTQTIRSSLGWLHKTLHERGERLAAGQIVLTGSIPSLLPIDGDCSVRVAAPPVGEVTAEFVS